MPKVNVSLDDDVRDDLVRLVPSRQRSRLVNEVLREALQAMKRERAMTRLTQLRQQTATLRAAEILAPLRKDRSRQAR
jgi:Arc/MetJ family transcription regulator